MHIATGLAHAEQLIVIWGLGQSVAKPEVLRAGPTFSCYLQRTFQLKPAAVAAELTDVPGRAQKVWLMLMDLMHMWSH